MVAPTNHGRPDSRAHHPSARQRVTALVPSEASRQPFGATQAEVLAPLRCMDAASSHRPAIDGRQGHVWLYRGFVVYMVMSMPNLPHRNGR